MTQPEAFNDQAKMTELQNQLSEVSDSLAETESDWEAKSIELEEYND